MSANTTHHQTKHWRELDAALTRGWREVPLWAIG